MAHVDWLQEGEVSRRWIVTTPKISRPTPDPDVARLDTALDGFSGSAPVWFRLISRTGRWWYAICIVIALVLTLIISPSGLGLRIAVGVTLGLILALLSGFALRATATALSRANGGVSAKQLVIDLSDTVRPVPSGIAERAMTVIAANPAREAQVHELMWQAAQGSSDEQAIAEIVNLWQQAAPDEANAHQAKVQELQAQLDDLNNKRRS